MLNSSHNRAIAVFFTAEGSADQERHNFMRDFARLHELTVVGFLAIDRTNVYKALCHAISLCQSQQATVIVVDEPKTFTMPHVELIELLQSFIAHDLRLMFANDATELSLPILKIMTLIMEFSLKADNVVHSEKIKQGLKEKKRKGDLIGGRKYGALSSEERIIKQIIQLRKLGHSLQGICKKLADHDIKTAQNRKWHPTTIKRILDREPGT